MARIEVHQTAEFTAASDAGDTYTVCEYATVYVTANENAPVVLRTVSTSYKLSNGIYVDKVGANDFEIPRSGTKLRRRA